MKVAIVHYWLINMRGGEKVLEVLCDIFPQADIFTLVYNPGAISDKINRHKITTSFIQKLPWGVSKYQQYLPLHAFAIEQFDLSTYDLVISQESGIAKGVILQPSTCHICYCNTPMRYLWNMYHEYKKDLGLFKRIWWAGISNYLRLWDFVNSQRVDYFIADSQNARRRIKRYYNRESEVIYPPVDFDKFRAGASEDFYLAVSQLTPYKKIDLAIRTFNRCGKKLVVIGDGPQRKELEKLKGPNITLLGKQPDEVVIDYFARCKTFIFPGEEDFGITPLEAMASGKPVIAYGRGGALETILDGKTGLFFDELTEESLMLALDRSGKISWDRDLIRSHASKFDISNTRVKLSSFVIRNYEEFQRSQSLTLGDEGGRQSPKF
jgi:glycosyltransferase involved in cell wall biosynthesis